MRYAFFPNDLVSRLPLGKAPVEGSFVLSAAGLQRTTNDRLSDWVETHSALKHFLKSALALIYAAIVDAGLV
jgi:hypothetical protein